MDNGGRRHHTAAMGPHPRQQSTQQSTNIICDGSTSLKLEKTRKNSSNTCFFRKCDSTASWVIFVIWQQHFEENLVLNPKTKKSKDDEDCQVVHGNNGFCPSPSRWANPISDVENTRRNCAEGSIANLLYHLGDTTLYHSILLSMNQTKASVIYKIATGCTLNDSVTMPRAVVEGHFRDPIMKCL